VDGVAVAKIALAFQVSASTMSRRLTAIRQGLHDRLRCELARRIGLSTETLESIIRALRKEIDISLSALD
jgi:hypothetical protein